LVPAAGSAFNARINDTARLGRVDLRGRSPRLASPASQAAIHDLAATSSPILLSWLLASRREGREAEEASRAAVCSDRRRSGRGMEAATRRRATATATPPLVMLLSLLLLAAGVPSGLGAINPQDG